MTLLTFLWKCYQVYRSPDKLTYFALSYRGVPFLTMVIARDREAWRVSQFAQEAIRRIS